MTQAFHVPTSAADADPKRWVAMAVLLAATFMNLIDVTIVNVALPSMQANLGASPTQIEWVSAAYIMAFAVSLLPFGRLGDILGRTRMFLAGVGLFTLASAACGMAPSIEVLIAARLLQGFAGALMTPQVLAIAQVTFPPQERAVVFSLFGLTTGLASVAGPILGGILIEANMWGLDWRPIFLVNVPIGIVALVAGWFLIARTPGNSEIKNDYVGIGLFGLAVVAMVYPLIEGRALGWPVWCFGLMLASVALAGGFVWWERRRAALDRPQLLNFSLVSNANFLLGMVVVLVFASGVPGLFLVISLLLQSGFGFTPLQSGLVNLPFSIGVLAASVIAGRMGSDFLRGRMVAAGILLVLGLGWLHMIVAGVTDSIDHWSFVAPLFVAGIGLGLGFSGLFQSVLAGVPARDAGSGSGSLQAFQQVGGSIGIALVGQIFFGQLGGLLAGGAETHVAYASAAASALLYEVGAFGLVILLVPFLKRATPATAAPPVAMLEV